MIGDQSARSDSGTATVIATEEMTTRDWTMRGAPSRTTSRAINEVADHVAGGVQDEIGAIGVAAAPHRLDHDIGAQR